MATKSRSLWLDVNKSLSHIDGPGSNPSNFVEHHYELYMTWCLLREKSCKICCNIQPSNHQPLTSFETIA